MPVIVEGGRAEELLVRSAQGAIHKIKPEFTVDAVIIGFTRRTEDTQAVRSLLLGLTREDGSTQVAGACGNLGSDDDHSARLLPGLSGCSQPAPQRGVRGVR